MDVAELMNKKKFGNLNKQQINGKKDIYKLSEKD